MNFQPPYSHVILMWLMKFCYLEVDNTNCRPMIMVVVVKCGLQAARKELITGLDELLTGRSMIGLKRMGELDAKSFHDACKKNFKAQDADTQSCRADLKLGGGNKKISMASI